MANAALLKITFSGLSQIDNLTVGPFAGIRVSENFMHALPEGQVMARYVQHQWQLRDQFYSSYECVDRSCVWFSNHAGDETERFGPFARIFVADGTLYANDKLFAKFIDESILWHSFKLDTWWPTILISAA